MVETTVKPSVPTSVRRRLLPLQVAVALQGFMLWVPVEKLFMKEIGFDAASVGVMAAAYAALVPLVEIPSGLLADRWSRRGVLIVASAALMLTSLVGGLSNSVPLYIVSALFLAVYFAMYSGTMEAVVYDTLLEETGDSDGFERRIGRVRFVESATLVASSLAGGVIAGLATPRLTYFLTVPFALASIAALLRFDEPQLHKAEESTSLRSHVAVTYRTITQRRELLPAVVLTVLTALMLQVIFEFGPLWLVASGTAPGLYGPFWAGLVSTLGLGGLLAGRVRLDRARVVTSTIAVLTLASWALTATRNLLVVTIAQFAVALVVVTMSIYVSRVLHDAVPSSIRSGVVSGIGALSWISFLPFSLVFGEVSKAYGVDTAAWMITAVAVLAAVALVTVVHGDRAQTAADPEGAPEDADEPAAEPDRVPAVGALAA
ncbi:MAG TPA: MFS transporter [Acidimicrobiales bacterium]|nr:MFS transporter [Acidimicrobiales bacterium]